MKMAVGIFPGSFNPIHIGHLALANWIREFCGLDELWFLVSPLNPFKDEAGLMDGNARLRMVEAAIDGYPGFKACDIEFRLPRPSYTINTLRELRRQFPDTAFLLIMGADNWENISCWKNFDELVDEFPIIIYPRKDCEITVPEKYANIKKVEAPLLEISSTFIRRSVREHRDVRFFLPEKVWAMRELFNP
ncbi:MAG: nicotinate-nucleotide adenylyltransferase [Tannerella sp.]|jgi:nicotinate-nucleotide adenylyltransferase|nr:nicotinate-nucleotide adenylyltransferase [Tannerella sp.]